MTETTWRLFNISIYSITINEIRWFKIENTKLKPGYFIKSHNIKENDYLFLLKEHKTHFTGSYVFSWQGLLTVLSFHPEMSIHFIENYFNNNPLDFTKSNEIKKNGRKRKNFNNLSSKSSKYARKKEVENVFESSNEISIYDFICDSVNYADICKSTESNNLYEYLHKFYDKKTILVDKIPVENIILAKDSIILSYEKLNKFRKLTGLSSIIPCTNTILKYTKILNKTLKERYNIISGEDCCAVGNVSLFLNDYARVFINKYPEKKKFVIKWTSDQRTLINNIGNVGLAVQILDEIDNQMPENQIYLCIGNGKEDLSFFEKNLSHIKEFCSSFVDNSFTISDVTFESFFLADLKHLWENCTIKCIEIRSEFTDNFVVSPPSSSLNEEELSLYNKSQNEVILLTRADDDDYNSDADTEDSENELNENSEMIFDDFDQNISHRCHMCGLNLKQFRENTRKKMEELEQPIPSISVMHWIGVNVKYFCILHCAQRCMERIFFHFGMNDKLKTYKIERALKGLGLIRKKWKFSETYSNRRYPQMIFGTEVQKILNNVDKWFIQLPWLSTEDREIIDQWVEVYKILNFQTEKLESLIEQDDGFSPFREKIDRFVSSLISRFGKESIQFYFHFIDYHVIDILKEGRSLCLVQNQGFEKSHSLHKSIQKNMCSNESGFHKTPSYLQILMRQLRILHIKNRICDLNINQFIDTLIDDPLFDILD